MRSASIWSWDMITKPQQARPVVKWCGGKHESVPHILRHLPDKIETYFEPFFGGGSVFFALASEGRFKRAVISDACEELIGAHIAIRDDVDAVLTAIRRLGPGHVTEDKYYCVRNSRPRTNAGKAARFLFLNKCGFNGLYRVNSFGKFNVPWGHRSKWIVDVENLRAVSRVLQRVDIVLGDFEIITTQGLFPAKPGDAVYFDPPYLPRTKSEKFTSYTRYGFGFDEQQRLARTFATLETRGVHVVASNADTSTAMLLYGDIQGTKFRRTHVSRAVNSNGKGRGKVGELLIVNAGNTAEK
jgi:DNA adenine methylase